MNALANPPQMTLAQVTAQVVADLAPYTAHTLIGEYLECLKVIQRCNLAKRARTADEIEEWRVCKEAIYAAYKAHGPMIYEGHVVTAREGYFSGDELEHEVFVRPLVDARTIAV